MNVTNLTGQTLAGRYQVVRAIGEGGMGVVYEAVQLGLGRRVAIKLVSSDGRHNADALARFKREAETAAALGHPNIVQVTDFVDAGDGRPFIVMEMIDGESLRAIVAREGRLDPTRVCFIAGQILSALSAAHRAGIVHRDIKPGNIVVLSTTAIRDFVKVVDFGIAKLQKPGSLPSGVNTVVGTPSYMAPEQATGTDVDARADVYGVAATMLNALTAHPPPHPPVPPIAHIAPWIPPALATVLDRALSVNPLGRYANADAMLEALAPFLREGGIDPNTIGRGAPATTLSAPQPRMSAPPGTPYAPTHPMTSPPFGSGPPTQQHAQHTQQASMPPPRTSFAPPSGYTGAAWAGQPPPNTTVPPTMPSNVPPVAAAPSSSGSAGWIVAVVLGVILLLVVLGGGAVAAYYYANHEDEKPDRGKVATTADTGTIAAATTTTTPTSTPTSKPTSGGAKPTATPTAAKDAGTAPPLVADAGTAPATVDAGGGGGGGGGGQVASKRTYRMTWFRPSDSYDLIWVNKKLATPSFGACLDKPFFDAVEDRQGLWTVAYDPNGEVFEVYYAPTYKKGGGTNAQLRDCAKAAWMGTKLGAGRHPGAGNLQILIDVKSE